MTFQASRLAILSHSNCASHAVHNWNLKTVSPTTVTLPVLTETEQKTAVGISRQIRAPARSHESHKVLTILQNTECCGKNPKFRCQ